MNKTSQAKIYPKTTKSTFAKNPQQLGRSNMKNYGFIKIVNITLENASAIEKMVNKAISDLNKQKIKILDLQITEDNIFLVLKPL